MTDFLAMITELPVATQPPVEEPRKSTGNPSKASLWNTHVNGLARIPLADLSDPDARKNRKNHKKVQRNPDGSENRFRHSPMFSLL